MTDQTPGFRRDVTILLRYRWFILAVFVVAILGAIVVGSRGSTESRAHVAVEIWQTERQPVFGIRPLVAFSEYQALGSSNEVADRAAANLVSEGREVDPGTLRASITVADTSSPDLRAIAARQFEFTATASDEATARAYVSAWADAYVEEASAVRDARNEDQVLKLERQAETAATELDERQQALNDYLEEHPEASSSAPGALEDMRGRVTLAIQRLESIQAQGGASTAAVALALADLFPEEPVPDADIATLIEGFNLRLDALNEEIAAFGGQDSTASEARQLVLARDAGQQAYTSALAQLAAARAFEPVPSLEFRPPGDPMIVTSREIGMVGLVGAAAALGLAVGIVGAFAIEFLTRYGLLPWSGPEESA